MTIRFAGWISGRIVSLQPAFKLEPDTDTDIRNGFIDISRIQTFGKSCTLHNHSRYNYGTIIHSLSSEASFQPSVP